MHGERSLCFGCRNGQVVKGLQASDLSIRCMAAYEQVIYIRKPVAECSEFSERTGQTRKEMEKIGWILETKKGRPIGFVSPIEHKWRADSGVVDEDEN